MRHSWKGSIAFGMVNIPVGLGTAVRADGGLSFRMLRESDMSPIQFKRVAEADGKEVPFEKIAKGYEYEKDKFVLVTKEDFERVEIAATKSISIETFADAEDVSPLHFNKAYYMEPQKGADHAFVLLRDALIATRKIGIARVVISTREHLAAVRPHDGTLILELMHFADEIVPSSEVRKPMAALGKKEIDLAKGLIAQMSEPWQPEAHKDKFTGQLLAIIDKKVKAGGKLAPSKRRAAAEAPMDILSVLQQSINAAGRKKPGKVTAMKTKPRKAG